mmetsp:Transcript_62999/g.184247  ORF Transcript_62999/g.184247 Transcript_62999/m.184247 type:complete len:188 (-) Transcript_62999:98-661(-)
MRAAAVVLALACAAPVHGSRLLRKEHEPDASSPASAESRLEALQPVLEKLRGLDPKTFGMLSGMLEQAQGSHPRKESFLQFLQDDPDEVQARLEKLAPILDRLKGLDPKAFGMLNGLVKQGQSQEAVAPEHPAHSASLLQADPAPEADEAQRKLEALQPVLEKLKGLDGKAFGMLSSMMSQATGQHS